jgi:hypothetical protein
MKKYLMILFISVNLLALDQSVSDSNDMSYKENTSQGFSKNINTSNSKSLTKSNSKTREKSVSENTHLSRIEQVSSFVALIALEKSGIEPFASCQILSKPRLPIDFELSCQMPDGTVNSGRCNFLQTAAQSNLDLDSVTYKGFEVKQYAACVSLYGALIAQDMKYDKFTPYIFDQEIKRIYEDFEDSLENGHCRLNGSASMIACGSTQVKIDFEPLVISGGITLYSNQTYFGYSSSKSKDKSKRLAETFSLTKSKVKSKANSLAKSLITNIDESVNIQKASSNSISLSKFLPGE